jgi:hypothetical protein
VLDPLRISNGSTTIFLDDERHEKQVTELQATGYRLQTKEFSFMNLNQK